MEIARSLVNRLNEVRLQRALEQAHRARLAFLREDQYDGDCPRCARRVQAAEDRVRELEARIAACRPN
jgi:hypothetical protein